jgi:hypothetical protein
MGGLEFFCFKKILRTVQPGLTRIPGRTKESKAINDETTLRKR